MYQIILKPLRCCNVNAFLQIMLTVVTDGSFFLNEHLMIYEIFLSQICIFLYEGVMNLAIQLFAHDTNIQNIRYKAKY